MVLGKPGNRVLLRLEAGEGAGKTCSPASALRTRRGPAASPGDRCSAARRSGPGEWGTPAERRRVGGRYGYEVGGLGEG